MLPEIQKIINKAKKDSDVLALALFGSYARGEKNYRDIDICVFLKAKIKNFSKKKIEYISENEKYDVQIFQQLPIYIRDRIMKEAKFVYVKDENQLYELFFATQRESGHFAQFYQDYLNEVKNGSAAIII